MGGLRLETPFCGCVLIECKHALILVTTRWQRSVELILLRSFLVGLPFGGGVLVALVNCGGPHWPVRNVFRFGFALGRSLPWLLALFRSGKLRLYRLYAPADL
jgi:hypothetical protein